MKINIKGLGIIVKCAPRPEETKCPPNAELFIFRNPIAREFAPVCTCRLAPGARKFEPHDVDPRRPKGKPLRRKKGIPPIVTPV
jgi:hypothetical protein